MWTMILVSSQGCCQDGWMLRTMRGAYLGSSKLWCRSSLLLPLIWVGRAHQTGSHCPSPWKLELIVVLMGWESCGCLGQIQREMVVQHLHPPAFLSLRTTGAIPCDRCRIDRGEWLGPALEGPTSRIPPPYWVHEPVHPSKLPGSLS